MLLNLLVIHFAFGSPFGMYQITRGGSVRSAKSAASVAAHFVLWPIFAAAFIRNWFAENLKPSEKGLEYKIVAIRTQIEDLAFCENSTASILEFREVFDRFTGLTLAIKQDKKFDSSQEIFKVTCHPNTALASACLAKRNQKRLSFHLNNARDEITDMILSMASASQKRAEIFALTLNVANLLNDQTTANYFLVRSK